MKGQSRLKGADLERNEKLRPLNKQYNEDIICFLFIKKIVFGFLIGIKILNSYALASIRDTLAQHTCLFCVSSTISISLPF